MLQIILFLACFLAFGAVSLAVPTPQPMESRDVLPDGQTVSVWAFYDMNYQGASFGGGYHYNECCESTSFRPCVQHSV
jgi:hypothetical protein